MKFDVQYKGRTIRLDITSEDSLYRLEYEDKKLGFRCERIDESCLSIMVGERSYEAHVHAAPPAYAVQLQDLSYDFEVMEGGDGGGGRKAGRRRAPSNHRPDARQGGERAESAGRHVEGR